MKCSGPLRFQLSFRFIRCRISQLLLTSNGWKAEGIMKCSGPLSQVPVNWFSGLSGVGYCSFYCTSNDWKAEGTMKCSGPLSQVPVNWVSGLSGAGYHSFYCTSNGRKADTYSFQLSDWDWIDKIGLNAFRLARFLYWYLSFIFMSLRKISCDVSLSLLVTQLTKLVYVLLRLPVLQALSFLKRFLYCSEVYKNFYMNLQFKTVPDTSLH
jgi:hypothetical protein